MAHWKASNKEQYKQDLAAWYQANKDQEKQKSAERRAKNPDYFKQKKAEWYQRNKEQVKRKNKEYQKQYSSTNHNFKLGKVLRRRLNNALKTNQKAGSPIRDLGCSIPELRSYLESKWQPGMTWENHGSKGWHIDHIIPLSSFDLTDREQFLKACHYSNLQPLWWQDNLSKSNRLP